MDSTKLGGSAFWILVILVSLVGLSYLGVWSYHNNSVKGLAISVIFFGMILTGIIFSKFEIFNSGSWEQNCTSFMIAFVIWVFLGGSDKSILSLTQNNLFASISSDLPRFLDFTLTAFVIPVSEELLWLIGIPFAIMAIMDLMGIQWKFMKNIWLQIGVISIVSGITFALFHVGKLFIAFLVAAFIFRTVQIVLTYGDIKANIFPWIALVSSFGLGAHIGNNWGDYGFSEGMNVLTTSGATGWLILLLFAAIFVTMLIAIVRLFTKKDKVFGGT